MLNAVMSRPDDRFAERTLADACAMKVPPQNEYAILDHYLDASTKKDIHRGIDHFLEIGGGFCDIGRYSDVRCLV